MNVAARMTSTENPSITAPLSDLLGEDLDVLFCGINPALTAARSGHHFSHGSNRFWRVLHLAGFTPYLIQPDEDHTILNFGYGLTAAVERPTARASELVTREFDTAAKSLEQKVRQYRPCFLAFLGKRACTTLFRTSSISWGRQSIAFGGAETWVLPNPSGLNRAFTLDALAAAYHELRIALKR